MLITEKVKVKYNFKTKDHYINLGYEVSNGLFHVSIIDLTNGSRVIVEAKCDYCDNIRETEYKSYYKNISHNNKYACCNKCACEKKKEISLENYGVDSPSKLDEIKEKNKKTNLERYGVDCYMKTTEFRDKSKQTNLERYGVENPMDSNEIKDKLKKTNLEKYGVENPFQSEAIKDKIKENNFEKYGFEYYQSTEEFKKKYKDTILDKYGVEHVSQNEEIKEKMKQTNFERYGGFTFQSEELSKKARKTILEKYGVEHVSQNEEIKEKMKQTNLEKLGVEYPMQSIEVREKSKNTNIERYGSEYITQSDEIRKEYHNIAKRQKYIKYIGDKISLFECDRGHNFEIKSDNYIHRKLNNTALCTICHPISDQKSIKEKEVLSYIESIYDGEIISSYRDVYEIDIYLPHLNIGFEFNGIYYHSEKFKDKDYHLYKTNYFKNKGIRIIHIWEDDWGTRKEIIKSLIKNYIGVVTNKIYDVDCVIKELTNLKLINEFISDNSIQESSNHKIKIGLFFNDELVSIMLFDKYEDGNKMEEGEWNISLFCDKINTNIIDSAFKLLKYFTKTYNPKRIISYNDNGWGYDNLYENLGFTLIKLSKPDFKYFYKNQRLHKSNFKKSMIVKKFGDIKTSKSIFLIENKIYKIWDCGKLKYELKNPLNF